MSCANATIINVFGAAVNQSLRPHYLVVDVFTFGVIVVVVTGEKGLFSITCILQNKKR